MRPDAAHMRAGNPSRLSRFRVAVYLPYRSFLKGVPKAQNCAKTLVKRWLYRWRPHGESNPGLHRERVMSCPLDDGDVKRSLRTLLPIMALGRTGKRPHHFPVL